MQSTECRVLEFGSPEQLKSIELRREILRIPLGIDFSQEELEEEKDQCHIACIDDGRILGILLLKPVGTDVLKMRQVAVGQESQGRGVGSDMVRFSEAWASERAYKVIELHARKTAVEFYLRLGYRLDGEEFAELGIPHYRMLKTL